MQDDLFTAHERAEAERDAGIAQAQRSADQKWLDEAWRWLNEHLRNNATFFSDDAWESGLERPREARAFGPVVLRASRAGLMVKTNEMRPRTSGHMTPAPVWRSLVYEP
jgi:hypothetical protein